MAGPLLHELSPTSPPMNGSRSHRTHGSLVHPLFKRKRSHLGGRYIYLYIFLRNHALSLVLFLLLVIGAFSFLRPTPSLGSSNPSPATATSGAATTAATNHLEGQGESDGQAHTGRQLAGAEGASAGVTGMVGAQAQRREATGGTMSESSRRSQSLESVLSQQYAGAEKLTKDELLAMVKRDPDSEIVKAAVMQQRFRDSVPVFGFVHFSSYRTSPVQFVALGFSAVVMRYSLRLGRCLWKEKHGGHRVMGNLTALYPGEHHEMRYEAVVIVCQLEESTENDYGGVLLYTIDGEDIITYIEEKGQYPVATPKPPYKYQLAYCTPPLTGQVSSRRMYEWIEYHLHTGVDRIVVYDGGAVDTDVVAMLDSFKEQGISIQIVNVRGVKGYPAWDNGRLLTTNDCMYRHRFTARWVFMAEMSEYFSSESGSTLLGLLNTHDGKPYISLGSRWWSLERCVVLDDGKQKQQAMAKHKGRSHDDEIIAGEGMILGNLDAGGWTWGVEKMLFHWPHYYCTNKKDFPKVELCIDYHGFRRYAVDPRLVSSAQIHRTEVPRLGGIDIDADVARLNRYPGILEENPTKECTKLMSVTEVVDWWAKDHQVSLLSKEAKQQPHAQFRAHVRRGRGQA